MALALNANATGLAQLSEKVENVHRLVQACFAQQRRNEQATSSRDSIDPDPPLRERPSVVDLRIGSLTETQNRRRTRIEMPNRRPRHLPTPRAELQARPSTASIAAGLHRRRRRRTARETAESGSGNTRRRGTAVRLTDAYLDELVHRHSASIQQRYLEHHYFFATTQSWVRNGSASMNHSVDVECLLGQGLGMRQTEIAALSSFTVTEENLDSCCICIDTICEGHEAITLPCSHTFHQQCISRWLTRRRECPLCKHHIERSSRNTSENQ